MNYVLKVVVDGNETLVPIEAAAELSVAPGAQISVVEAATGEVVENVTVARSGEALVLSVDGEQIAVLEGFYADGAGAVFSAGEEHQITSADADVWTRSAHVETGLGGHGLAIAGLGLGGLAVAAASGGDDEAAQSTVAPVDSGVDVTVTFELDQDINSTTYGKWISTIEGQEGNAISADLTYNIVIKVPLEDHIMDGAQTTGDIQGDGMLSQAWNLGSDDMVTYLLPEEYSRAGGATHVYMSHSAQDSAGRHYNYQGMYVRGEHDLWWLSLEYDVSRTTSGGQAVWDNELYMNFASNSYDPNINVFTADANPFASGVTRAFGVMDDNIAYYNAGTGLAA